MALMPQDKSEITEQIQRLVAKTVAVNPVGHGLQLIGGFRYRFLDQGPRRSVDVDYHWSGDLHTKQLELIDTLKRRLVPEIRRRLGYEGDVQAATGPESESPSVRIVLVAFWLPNTPDSRIEIPVEITRIPCLDPTTVRTVGGVVYPTVSDADMVESKIFSLFNRRVIQHRDFVDLFLFASHVRDDAAQRLAKKFADNSLDQHHIQARLDDFRKHPAFHLRAIAAVIAEQLDATVAANIEQAGGAKHVFERVSDLLTKNLKLGNHREMP
jgi:hypothetical protein